MAIQLGTTLRNARLDTIETTVGTTPHLIVRSGAQPADCATADSGSVIIDLTLPSDWANAASGGTKTKLGTWSGTASGSFTAGHHRIKDSSSTTTHLQGSCGTGTGDLSFDNAAIVSGQTVTINSYTFTEANA